MKFLVLFFLLLSVTLFAQQNEDDADSDTTGLDQSKWINRSTLKPIIEPGYNSYTFNNRINSATNAFYNDIINNYPSVSLSFNGVGYGDAGFLGIIPVKDVTLAFNYFLPIEKKYSDSLTYKFNAYNFYIHYAKDLFYDNKTLDLSPTYGYGFSSASMQRKLGEENTRYRNPAFIFNFLVELRINLINYKNRKLLSLGTKGGYQADCSNPNWRTNKKITTNMGKYRQSGFFVQGFISINFH